MEVCLFACLFISSCLLRDILTKILSGLLYVIQVPIEHHAKCPIRLEKF